MRPVSASRGSGSLRVGRARGSMTVEMALVSPFLIFLLFGIVDMGLLFRDTLMLGSACREAVRMACVGCPTTDIQCRAMDAAESLNKSCLRVQMSYRQPPADSWITLADGPDGTNCAPSGSQVRVAMSYPHTLIFGPIASMFGDNGSRIKTLRSSMVARRE